MFDLDLPTAGIPLPRRRDQRRRLRAPLALATVLVFAVTRVIFIPQGEFVAYGALTLALLQLGKMPGTAWLLLVLAAIAAIVDLVDGRRLAPSLVLGAPGRHAGAAAAAVVALHLVRAAPLPAARAERADAGHRHLARPAGLPARLPAPGRCQRAGAVDRLGRRALRADRTRPGLLRRRGPAIRVRSSASRSRRSPSRARPSSSPPRWC